MTQATELSVRQRQRQIAAWHLPEARRALERAEQIAKLIPWYRPFYRRRVERSVRSLRSRIAELQWAAGTRNRRGRPGV